MVYYSVPTELRETDRERKRKSIIETHALLACSNRIRETDRKRVGPMLKRQIEREYNKKTRYGTQQAL